MFAVGNNRCEGILTLKLPLISTCGFGVLGRGMFVDSGARRDINSIDYL